MPFEKGRQKTGGRKVGVTNRTTAEIREKVQMVLFPCASMRRGAAGGVLVPNQKDNLARNK